MITALASVNADISYILIWWSTLFVIGAAAYPLTRRFFFHWWDQGYSLTKAVGIVVVTWIVWQLGSYKILPFTSLTIVFALFTTCCIGVAGLYSLKKKLHLPWLKIVLLEGFFFAALLFWSYIKAHEPDIRSLEKFMDYGFSAAIQQSLYFPPPDMWYAGGTVNYYYFGHLVQALLSTLSGIHLSYGYNLMLATLFALCFTISFSIGVQIFVIYKREEAVKRRRITAFASGLLSALLVTLSGNMQTIYAFTKGYTGEEPLPFWNLLWPLNEFLIRLPEGFQSYWYANATRFIPFTIHEFPSYSFVVSDNHGHVFNIPFVLLMLASLLTYFIQKTADSEKTQSVKSRMPYLLFGGLIGVLLMTNALDGPVYLGLFGILVLLQRSQFTWFSYAWIKEKALRYAVAGVGFIVATLPFLVNFDSFASGLAVNCPPAFLQNTAIGPILFETADKCQRSPLWMMVILWGFFWFTGAALLLQTVRRKRYSGGFSLNNLDVLLGVFWLYALVLIWFAEFFYFKDIYPAHFRSNTMFKFGYQAFIISSFVAGFAIIRFVGQCFQKKRFRWKQLLFLVLVSPQLFLIFLFPVFAVYSYFGNLQTYKGLYGLSWFQRDYPDDYQAFLWLLSNLQDSGSASIWAGSALSVSQQSEFGFRNNWLSTLAVTDVHVRDSFFTRHIADIPVILEADGDSYTDYNRLSAFTGLPTIIGWGVHEWLWRGTYDVVAPRREEVRELYESDDQERIKELLRKYNVQYAIVGEIERKKYPQVAKNRFDTFGTVVFSSGDTRVYRIDKEVQ